MITIWIEKYFILFPERVKDIVLMGSFTLTILKSEVKNLSIKNDFDLNI